MAADVYLSNRNFLSSLQSQLVIRRLPNVEFFCQRAVIPGVSMVAAQEMSPFVTIKKPGDVVNFNEFQVTFIVDEYLVNYTSVFDWMMALGFPVSYDQHSVLTDKPGWSDEGVDTSCSIMLLDSAGRPKVEARFENAFPVQLSDVEVDSTQETLRFVTATALFAYRSYTISQIN